MDPLTRKLLVGDGWAYVSADPTGTFPDAAQACEACGRQRSWRFVWFHLTRKVVRCLRCGVPRQPVARTDAADLGDLFAVPFEE